jgi:hypothetical protein
MNLQLVIEVEQMFSPGMRSRLRGQLVTIYATYNLSDRHRSRLSSGVSRVWQAGHVPWAPLAGGFSFVWVSTF